MKKLKIALLSTAILVGVNHAALAAYTQNDLNTLRELSNANDTQAVSYTHLTLPTTPYV